MVIDKWGSQCHTAFLKNLCWYTKIFFYQFKSNPVTRIFFRYLGIRETKNGSKCLWDFFLHRPCVPNLVCFSIQKNPNHMLTRFYLNKIHIQAKGAKRQYMEVARSLKFYGYMVFKPGLCDYPEPHTRATLALGKTCLNMRLYTPSGEIKEVSFKVTRIRCWRIMTSGKPLASPGAVRLKPEQESKLELSFEYLVSADKLQWINVISSQAILMSLCLQSMVEELVRIKSGEKEPKRLTKCMAKKHQHKIEVIIFNLSFCDL